MPVKRALRMDNAQHHTPPKIPVLERKYSPLTGTASLQAAGRAKTTRHDNKVLQTDIEKLDSLRSRLEQSVDAFIKARKELEEIVSAEGSSKLRSFFTGSSADLKTELKRHRELTSRVESSLKGNDACQNPSQGGTRTGSSYEFLKSVIG